MKASANTRIEQLFRRIVDKDPKLQNAYLHVVAPSRELDIHLCGGHSNRPLHIDQPNYMASVGKLFTATLVAQLHEAGALHFEDPIVRHLPADLCSGLHVYKEQDYTTDIQIRHLLNQSSGLPDHFQPLLQNLADDPNFMITPHEAILWARDHLQPVAPPGRKVHYTDTNYHLLGLIIEQITGQDFHEVVSEQIFQPLGMRQSYMLHRSDALEPSPLETAEVFMDGIRVIEHPGYGNLDYAGGSVVGPGQEFIRFMQGLVSGELVQMETLARMQADKGRLYPGIDYGYGIWQFRPIPLILPKKLTCWGVAGVSGAFLFYHPATDATLCGTFNDTRYRHKGLRFMLKVINMMAEN